MTFSFLKESCPPSLCPRRNITEPDEPTPPLRIVWRAKIFKFSCITARRFLIPFPHQVRPMWAGLQSAAFLTEGNPLVLPFFRPPFHGRFGTGPTALKSQIFGTLFLGPGISLTKFTSRSGLLDEEWATRRLSPLPQKQPLPWDWGTTSPLFAVYFFFCNRPFTAHPLPEVMDADPRDDNPYGLAILGPFAVARPVIFQPFMSLQIIDICGQGRSFPCLGISLFPPFFFAPPFFFFFIESSITSKFFLEAPSLPKPGQKSFFFPANFFILPHSPGMALLSPPSRHSHFYKAPLLPEPDCRLLWLENEHSTQIRKFSIRKRTAPTALVQALLPPRPLPALLNPHYKTSPSAHSFGAGFRSGGRGGGGSGGAGGGLMGAFSWPCRAVRLAR